MVDGDWPSRRHALERWLALDNFDVEGRQKQRLSDSTRPAKTAATADETRASEA